ncbi:ferrous iron transport protein B [Rossellomorea vietnamensis]|uniref:Ferrous iron transport protein B n=1 Tax=Rossellomorea vietnamensis TaxID=218284 RepID=A0ACD4C2Y4_9BACI|nr:ferrous iron transport protein B [Rossellomorea vietnamensis]UXH42910.1 ferrous iron transport protein B [Rossellomorea vietnamensis]
METALLGNPNTGKTSLFNQITGSYEYVGNWSGVTVEKKVGRIKDSVQSLIDLPGVYSLNPLSHDERVASMALLQEEAGQILNIVNANQLERSLYLTIELLETNLPTAIVLNMMDLAEKRGIKVDVQLLGELLGVKSYSAIARKGKGCDEIIQLFRERPLEPASLFTLDYGPVVEAAISKLLNLMGKEGDPKKRWVAIQYLIGNELVQQTLNESYPGMEAVKEETEAILLKEAGHSLEESLYATRKSFIQKIVVQVTKEEKKQESLPLTAWLDHIATHPIFGIPFFLLVLLVVFQLTFGWLGTPISDALDSFFAGPLTAGARYLLDQVNALPFIKAVILEGIIAGVGGVLVFVPQIFILFFFISLLEDSGYMARVAVVMDRLMEFIGLNGKAFIPLIIGFGCNVPSIMAARTIEQPKERLLTILISPFMSCSARLSVYALFVAAFFSEHQAIIVLSLYVLGIVVAILVAKVFSFFLKNEKSYFVMELPPYNVPQPLHLIRSTWDKGKGFVRKAGTFIFGGTVFIWLFSYLGPNGAGVPIDESFMAIVSGVFAPVFAPLGFASWQAVSALFTGFLAKEVVVSTMNILYHVPAGETLAHLLPQFYTPLAAYTFLVFILLYTPCLATVAIMKKETGSMKLTLLSIVYSFIVAYIVAFIVYRVGQFIF